MEWTEHSEVHGDEFVLYGARCKLVENQKRAADGPSHRVMAGGLMVGGFWTHTFKGMEHLSGNLKCPRGYEYRAAIWWNDGSWHGRWGRLFLAAKE